MLKIFTDDKEEIQYIERWYKWLKRCAEKAPSHMQSNYIKMALLFCSQSYQSRFGPEKEVESSNYYSASSISQSLQDMEFKIRDSL